MINVNIINKYWYFGAPDNFKLIQYIIEKGDNWSLNESSLQELYKYFNGKFAREYLRKKAFKYGIEFISES